MSQLALFRRPLVLLGAVLCLVAAGCRYGSFRSSFRTSSGSAYMEAHGDGPVFVAFYENGRLYGAEAFDRIGGRYGRWGRGRPALDHPDLGRWRGQLSRGQDLAAAPDTRAADLLRRMIGFPFKDGRQDVYASWVGGLPERAADLLDRAEQLDVRREFALGLCEKALVAKVEDGRAARWMQAFATENYREAAGYLATSRACGEDTSRVALQRIDDFSSRFRRRIYEATAARLVARPGDAALIVSSLDELSSRDESLALRGLLESPDVSVELSIAALRDLDERSSRYRPELFTLASERCYRDARAGHPIARALEDISSRSRLNAMLGILAHPDVPMELVRMLIRQTRRLPSRDREVFLTKVIHGPHSDEDLAPLCAQVARSCLSSRARRRVLTALGRAYTR